MGYFTVEACNSPWLGALPLSLSVDSADSLGRSADNEEVRPGARPALATSCHCSQGAPVRFTFELPHKLGVSAGLHRLRRGGAATGRVSRAGG